MVASISDFLRREPKKRPFLFASGFECSYPVITGKNGKDLRRDELELTGHYKRWKEDFDLLEQVKVRVLRYGVPYYRVHLGPDRYDWSFVDETFNELKRRGVIPIADLCHFGVPDWIGNFQNPDFPGLFAQYAAAFAQRFPWVTLFTPVNEIFVAAHFSAKAGWWNERLKSDRAFVTALKHCCMATLLAQEAILKVQPQAVFIQSEATSYYHAEEPAAIDRAHFYNERRFLSLDLLYGVEVSSLMYEYLLSNGMTRDELAWCTQHGARFTPTCVMGNDYYATNEHMISANPDEPPTASGVVYGYYMITRQYFDRYRLPVMHTETNCLLAEDALLWLRDQWLNMVKLKEDGVPIVGFTWYSVLDQVDWDTALREDNNRVNEIGLFGLDRKPHAVANFYRTIIEKWKDILPMESRRLGPLTKGPSNADQDRN